MSTTFYAKRKKPKLVYVETAIGTRSNGNFYLRHDDYDEDVDFKINDKETLIGFVRDTNDYIFIDEYDREISKEEMIKIIKSGDEDVNK